MTQLEFGLADTPRDAAELLRALRSLGLRRITSCRLTSNRRVMVSSSASELRVHEGYLTAPVQVLRAIVTLVEGGRRASRSEARRVILSHKVPLGQREPRRESTHPADLQFVRRLCAEHERLNRERFDGALAGIEIGVSRRMAKRLGHYSPGSASRPPQISISLRHIRRHPWGEVTETLLHEMVHQWQHETGAQLDHGPGFRRKAREVGAVPRATRPVERDARAAAATVAP
jgi:hypothetical protein